MTQVQILELVGDSPFGLRLPNFALHFVALRSHSYGYASSARRVQYKIWRCSLQKQFPNKLLIPADYKKSMIYSDFYAAYNKILSEAEANFECVGKDTGLTNHVERWNCTLRQRVGRFVRKTLSFSKCEYMHELMLKMFIHDYNISLAK